MTQFEDLKLGHVLRHSRQALKILLVFEQVFIAGPSLERVAGVAGHPSGRPPVSFRQRVAATRQFQA